jgi:NAD(P)H-flavin reductase
MKCKVCLNAEIQDIGFEMCYKCGVNYMMDDLIKKLEQKMKGV